MHACKEHYWGIEFEKKIKKIVKALEHLIVDCWQKSFGHKQKLIEWEKKRLDSVQ